MKHLILTTGMILPLLAPCVWAQGGGSSIEEQLMQADRNFQAASLEHGLDGWLEFMSDDIVRLPGMGESGLQGKAAVRAVDASLFADPGRRLLWEPVAAGVFNDGRHGYTTGRYRVVVISEGDSEEVLGSGAYLTWWRLDDGGRWRVILDTGTPD